MGVAQVMEAQVMEAQADAAALVDDALRAVLNKRQSKG